jgi:hypothetical protein
MNGEIQYVSDTILLEKTFQVLAEFNDNRFEKYAFDLAAILPSIGSWVASHTGAQFRDEPNSILRTVEDLVVPGIAFGIHPLLGALVAVAEYFGYDLTEIYEKIKSAIMPDLKAGKPVTAEQINNAAQAAIPEVSETSSTEPPPEEGEADDLLYPLRAMIDKGQLTKEAIGKGNSYIARNRAEGGWLNPMKGLLNLFSARRRGSIIVGLLSWFLKTILLSAGLLAVAGVVGSVFSKKPGETGQEGTAPASQAPASQVSGSSQTPAPTGVNSYVYKKKPGDMWVEDLNGQQPHEMILKWALQSYPILNQYKSIILNTPSFWNTVREVTEDWRPGQADVVIPDPYKSRDEVVKLFIDDVFKAVNDQGRK